MKLLEDQVQRAVVHWFEMQHPKLAPRLHHSPNGGHRHKATAGRLKAMGTRKGFPDLALYVPRGTYQGCALELKAGKGKPTPEQIDWLHHLSEVGWFTGICNGVDEACAALRRYVAMGEP